MNYYDILLAKKLEDDRDPQVVGLSVTENGTYAEEGKVYKPVVVNVPLGSKSITANGTYNATSDNLKGYSSVDVHVSGYKITDVSGLSSAIASFEDGVSLPMPSLKVSIEPVQEGSGDPSPTNIRPISGWSAVDVTVADDVETPTVENVYTIDLDGTRYGGKLDVVSGVLTLTHEIVDLGTLTWGKSSLEATIIYTSIQAKKSGVSPILCSSYKYESDKGFGLNFGAISDSSNQIYINYVFVRNQDFSGKTDLECKTAMNGVQAVYELATPTTIQLTPTAVKSLNGQNNLSADTGDVVEASYWEEL